MRSLWMGTLLVLAVVVGGVVQPLAALPIQPGNLFVAYNDPQWGSSIGIYHAIDGTLAHPPIPVVVGSFAVNVDLDGGGGVAVDELGNLYVTVTNFKGMTNRRGIIKFNAAGVRVLEIDGGTVDFRGLEVSALKDRIYVATSSGIRVFRASNGTRLSGEDLGGTLAFRDVALDSRGNLYGLRAPMAGRVEVLRWTAGNFTGPGTPLFTDNGSGLSGYPDPRALAVDMDGNIYIAVNTSPQRRVVKFAPGLSGKYVPVAEFLVPSSVTGADGILFGLDFDPGTGQFFAVHTKTGGVGQLLTFRANDPSGTTMTAFGPNNLQGVRWLAVYPTPEPAAGVLLVLGIGAATAVRRWRSRRRSQSAAVKCGEGGF